MTFKVKLESHESFGYNNFFDTFREEYNHTFNQEPRKLLINRHLSEHNARIGGMSCLEFDTEDDFNWFVLRWT